MNNKRRNAFTSVLIIMFLLTYTFWNMSSSLYADNGLYCSTPNSPIPDQGYLQDSISILNTDNIVDMNVFISLTHPYVGDLDISLENQDQQTDRTTLLERPNMGSCSGDNLDHFFDDEGFRDSDIGCQNEEEAYPQLAILVPKVPLNHFDGISASGTWILNIEDTTLGNTGNLITWCLVPSFGEITNFRLSMSNDGIEGNGISYSLREAISSDGKLVVFGSASSNLVPNDLNQSDDVFLYNTETRFVSILSKNNDNYSGNDDSFFPAISGDGRYVAFASRADDIIVGDSNDVSDIFRLDTVTNQIERVSVNTNGQESNGNSFESAVSANGRYIAFSSDATNLVFNDSNNVRDVFLHDMLTGITSLISVRTNGEIGYAESSSPSISFDGRFVAFTSNAGFVSIDNNGAPDIYLHDRQIGSTSLLSRSLDGTASNGSSVYPDISGDGRFVVFSSLASNLVQSDTNQVDDIFIYDSEIEVLSLLSKNEINEQGNRNSYDPTISADSR